MSTLLTDDGYPIPAAQPLATALLAPYFAGWAAQLLFTGVALSSFVSYLNSRHYQRATKREKAFTYLVTLVNSGTMLMNTVEFMYWGTTQDRSIDHLYSETALDTYAPLPVIVIATIVQSFYIRRTAKLFRSPIRKWIFVGLMVFLQIASVIFALLTVVNLVTYLEGYETYLGEWNYYIVSDVWLWTGLVIDVTISATLWVLLKTRVAGFNMTTDSFLISLMKLAIQTASYTAIVSLGGAFVSPFVSNLAPEIISDVPAAFWIPLPSLYTISYFTTIRSQDRISEQLKETLHGTKSSQRTPLPIAIVRGRVPEIKVDVMVDVESEDYEGRVRGEDVIMRESRKSQTTGSLAFVPYAGKS